MSIESGSCKSTISAMNGSMLTRKRSLHFLFLLFTTTLLTSTLHHLLSLLLAFIIRSSTLHAIEDPRPGISSCHFQLMLWVRILAHLLCINYERSSSQWASRLTVAIVDCTPTTFFPFMHFPQHLMCYANSTICHMQL